MIYLDYNATTPIDKEVAEAMLPLEIRPTPEIINGWALKAGFVLEKYVELPPYHYGMVFIKKS